MTSRSEARVTPQDGDNTALVQSLIDANFETLSLIFEPGIHYLGGIRLRSNLTIEVSAGAELHFISNYDAYAATTVTVIAEESDRGMLVAREARNLAIVGSGRIFGNGAGGFASGMDTEMGVLKAHKLRPRVLVLEGCVDVRIENVRIDDAPLWTMHFIACDNVTVNCVTVENNRRMPNTDGIAIDACTNVLIERSSFRTADDAIVLKTTRRLDGSLTGACENVTARHCVVKSNSCALKIGTESFSPFRNIVFEDIRVENSNRAMGVFSRDGGVIEDVRFSRIVVDCQERPLGFWGSGEALTVNTVSRRPEEVVVGHVRRLIVEDVTGTVEGAINLVAERQGEIEGVVLQRITLTQRAGKCRTSLAYDLRPTMADRWDKFEEGTTGRANAFRFDKNGRIIGLLDYPGGLPAVFASKIEGLELNGVNIGRPSPLPQGWNTEAVVLL